MHSIVKPVLICGPTASGKSALGLELAQRLDGIIINADALQVYDCWRVLTARPDEADEACAPHKLYGHVSTTETYSVGAWLRDVQSIFANLNGRTPIIIGGTGLYFSALTTGLNDIPVTQPHIREIGNEIRNKTNVTEFIDYLSIHDPEILKKTDCNNAMRLQRAWEVHQSTGKSLSAWQSSSAEPLVSLDNATTILLNSNVEWLNERIAKRFRQMLDTGALDECQAVLDAGWDGNRPASRALGASELMAYLQGRMSLADANEKATISTRRFAKRQRTWFRSRMALWDSYRIDQIDDIVTFAQEIVARRKM